MPIFDLQDFAVDGIIRERDLRDAFAHFNWETMRGKSVHIRGCGEVTIPAWAFAMAAAQIAQYANKISYGEESSPIPVFERKTEAD